MDTDPHHWRVHLFFGDHVREEKITSRHELSIRAHCLFNGIHKVFVDKMRLDQMFNEPRLIPENAAPERRFNLLLRVAEIS